MNIGERCSLNSTKEAFLADLNPKYIISDLRECNVFTREEAKKIMLVGSTSQQVEKLFDILLKKTSKEFEKFISVLSQEDECGVYYPWLAEKLKQTNYDDFKSQTKVDLDDNVFKLLANGGVPFSTNCLLLREDKINVIRDKLHFASRERRHWVVLHGMTGTGKSILAAEALRDNYLIKTCFPEGIFWIKVGKPKNDNALGLKIKMLFQLLNKEDLYTASENLFDLTDILKRIVNPRMLVVLDDVWELHPGQPDVVKLFDIGCPFLVTTKFPGAFERHTDFCSLIDCRNDLSLEDSKELLSLYVKCKINELPSEVDWICNKCKGSPFTLSHIGRCMAPFENNVERWKNLKCKLESGFQSAMRQRHSSANKLNEIKKIIYLTLEPIEIYKNFLYDFVIFPEDVWVPSKVFEVLWDKSTFDVEDTMYCFVRTSLVQEEKDPSQNFTYGIHDLYLEILKDICKDATERHQNLVNNYLRRCKTFNGNYDFGLLPDDDYIHYYIGHHMCSAGYEGILDGIVLDDIYFDLKFIENKLRLDPRDLLVDYQTYKEGFRNQKELEVYKAFATKIAYTINKDCDIVQLALFEPADSIIHQKALALASQSGDKSYFEWCNQEENQSHIQNLSSKLTPFENMKYAAISSDGQLIACVGNSNKVSIFSSSTGEDLQVLGGHTSAINYCSFDSSRSKIISASDDKTVKLFDVYIHDFDMKPAKKRVSHPTINADMSKSPDLSAVTFTQHFYEVLCCNFSPDEDLVVSSDSNGCAHVWQSRTGDPKCYVNHSVQDYENNILRRDIKFCYFNSNGTLFGTIVHDSVKLWTTDMGEFYREILHDENVSNGFCFIKDYVISISNNEIYKYLIETNHQKQLLIKCQKNLIITCCCISPDDNYLACGTTESTVIVYNINTKKLINNLKGHKNDILSVMYTADSKKLLSTSKDGYIVHNMADIKDASLISFEGNLSVQQSSAELVIASSNFYNCIEIRKGYSGELYCKTDQEDSDVTACSLSSDCVEVVYGTKSGSVKVFNIESNPVDVVVLQKHTGPVTYITHSKNKTFFTCSEDKSVKMWRNRIPTALRGHFGSVLMCVPFKNSNKLLSCSTDGTLRVWDLDANGKMIVFTDGHGNQDVRFCDVSFDEKYLASASADQTVKLYDSANGTLYKTLPCYSEVWCCRFSPAFLILVSGCDTGKVMKWQLGSKVECKELSSHTSCVCNIYFSEDGTQFLSIADDIKIWKIAQTDPQTVLLPSSFMGVARPSIWASDNFDLFVVIHNSVLYILKKIVNSNGNSCH